MLSGNPSGYLLICATDVLSKECDNALRKSFAALGYGTDALTYLVATPEVLPPKQMYRLVEAIDPGIIVAADHRMKSLLSAAYNLPVDQNEASDTRVAGRPAVVFSDMARLMEDEAGHQQIWATLKRLPKRGVQ